MIYLGGALGVNTYLMKGFFDTVPRDLDEAARIDGASHAQVFFRIVLPLVAPVPAVVALRSFVATLNDFVIASLVIGDLPGVRSRLRYPSALGVDAVWLTPFYASPQADHGHDVADCRSVDPLFGTLQDAEALLRDAHAHGLRVIVDVVPNHTSEAHEWFVRRRRPAPARPRGSGTTSGPDAARAANSRPTNGSRYSVGEPGRGCRTVTGICTCSPPSNPTSRPPRGCCPTTTCTGT